MSELRHYLVEEFPRFDLADLRRAVGGRPNLKKADRVTVHLANGDIPIDLARIPANIANGIRTYMVCPRCRKAVLVLRVVPSEFGLLCGKCVKDIFRAHYASEAKLRSSTRTSVRISKECSHER